jgi:hypothetical protein
LIRSRTLRDMIRRGNDTLTAAPVTTILDLPAGQREQYKHSSDWLWPVGLLPERFPAPRPFHPDAGRRRQGISVWSSIRPSSTAAAASPQSSTAFTSQRSWEKHSPPKPPPRQIPIDGQALTASRAFVLRRLSDAGPCTGSPARARPASETLHESCRSAEHDRTAGFDPACHS